jgi:mannose-6-phosphate isomerase-like protein (cupin superfamily)
MSYIGNVFTQADSNNFFRKVIFTGQKSQSVIMSIPRGGEVGEETHMHVEQTLLFLSGYCTSILNDESRVVSAGDVVVVTPGTKHNFVNNGVEPVKIYTVYSPPNHIDGKIHETKADADKDLEDEAFGEKVE